MGAFDILSHVVLLTSLAIYLAGRYKVVGPLIKAPLPNPDLELQNLAYTQVKGDLWAIQDLTFQPYRGDSFKYPLTLWAVKDGSGWILIDAGIPEFMRPGFGAALIRAAKALETSQGGAVEMLVFTHGHIDHIGVVPALLDAFPGLVVGIHEGERPFVVNGEGFEQKSYMKLQSPSPVFGLWNFFMGGDHGITVPDNRTFYMQGAAGDVADLSNGGGKPAWTPTPGVLGFIHTPGHAPGHVVYVHKPTKALLSGDALTYTPPLLGGPPIVNLGPPLYTYNCPEAKASIRDRVLADQSWDTCYMAHTSSRGGIPWALVEEFGSKDGDYIWKSS